MRTSENINELAKAMSVAQKTMKPAIKTSTNPHFKSKFSDLSSVWDSIREPLTDNGLTLWQDVINAEKSVSVTTRIIHLSGQWVEFGPLTMPLFKTDCQAIGSAITYAKRYALCAALGVVAADENNIKYVIEDDDGNAAMPDNAFAQTPQQQPKKEENIGSLAAWIYTQGDAVAGWFDAFGNDQQPLLEYIMACTKDGKITRENFIKNLMFDPVKCRQSVDNWKSTKTPYKALKEHVHK